MKTAKHVIAAAVALCTVAAMAGDTAKILAARAKAGTPIVLGQWHAGFTEVKKYAESNGLPLLAIWSNGDECSHCKKLERCMAQSVFTTWMKQSGIVFYFGCNEDRSTDDKYGGTAYNWCWKNQSLGFFPFVRFYWKAKKGTVLADGTVVDKDKVLIDKAIVGDKFDNYKDKADGAKYAVSYAKKVYAQYVYDPNPVPAYAGGEFGYVDSVNSRLQVEVGGDARKLTVPLTRTNALAAAVAYTNSLVVAYPDSSVAAGMHGLVSSDSVVTNLLVWDAGEKSKMVEIDIPALAAGDFGKQIVLMLTEGETNDTAVATNHVDYVGETENSPSNPTWLGKKTVDTLSWGEWTMDLDVATNKVAKQGGGGTLILVGGSQWCPDCAAVDKWVIDTPEFKAWAAEKKIACVSIDIPRLASGADTPSLLTYDSYNTSARFYTYNYSAETNEALKVMGGAGYLSRNNISADEAAAVAARNAGLYASAVPKGLCRPECVSESNKKTGKFKTGIPALILLRPDGDFETGIAGRIYQFNNVSPSAANPIYVERIKELLATSDDVDEESNDDISTATRVIGTRESVEGKTLSFADGADYYKVSPTAVGSYVSYRLTGTDGVVLSLSLVNKTASTVETLVSATTNLAEDVVIGFDIPSNKTNCYVKVAYVADGNGYPVDEYFALDKDGSTVATYNLESDVVYVPAPSGELKSDTITDGKLSVSMSIVDGKTYYISNLDTSAEDFTEYFTPGKSANTYSAHKTTIAKLTLTAPEFSYRIWEAGVVSFDVASAAVGEKDGLYEIGIVRAGGKAGVAQATLWLDHTSTNFADQIEFDDDGRTFSWGNDETNAFFTTVRIVDNPYSDPNQTVRFYLTQEAGTSDAGLGTKNFLLTIRNDDAAAPGRLSVVALDPLPAKAGAVYARAGETALLAVRRTGGTTGSLAGALKASKGALDVDAVEFDGRDAVDRQVQLTLPNAAGTAKVTITGQDGAKVDSSARTLTYTVVAANAPQFEVGEVSLLGYRYTKLPETSVKVDENFLAASGDLSISKVSGSLPSGVKATFSADMDEIVFSGVPTKAGSFTAVYQVTKGKTAGLTVTLSLYVVDPTVKETGAIAPINASVLSSRTVKDIRVIDGDGRLEGLMTLTVPRNGKVSAKLRSVSLGTASFSAASWSSCDVVDGSLVAELAGTTAGAKGWTFKVTANADGSLAIDDFSDDYTLEVPADAYSADRPASDFAGTYTVSLKNAGAVEGERLCVGDGYVCVKMTEKQAKTGSATYAGLLPNGKTFSGSGAFAPTDWDGELSTPTWANARLPILSLSSADDISGVMRFDRARAAGYAKPGYGYRRVVYGDVPGAFRWVHQEPKAVEASYSAALEPAGGKYVSTENFAEIVRNLMEHPDAVMTFFAIPEGIGAFTDGDTPAAWNKTGYDLTFSYASKTKSNSIAKLAKGAAAGFTATFDNATGVLKGSFRLPTTNAGNDGYVGMTYRAVLLPGFGSTSCTDCGGDDEATVRPMVCGAAWADDTVEYEDSLGRTKDATVRRGCAVSVGSEPGK